VKDTAASTQHRGRAYIWHPRHRIHTLLNTVVISVRCIGSAAVLYCVLGLLALEAKRAKRD